MAVLFLLLLLLPDLGLLREKRNVELIAEMENRQIAAFPVLNEGSSAFCKKFEAWYDDRILGRKELIRYWAGLNGRLFHVLISKEVAQGKDGYLFMPFHLNRTLEDREAKIEQLSRLNRACRKAGASLTVFIAPNSEWVLGDLLPADYLPADVEQLERKTGMLLEKKHIDYCFIGTDFMRKNQQERRKLYLEGDYHWTRQGGYLGTRALLRHLGMDERINYPVTYHEEKSVGDIYTRKIGWEPICSNEAVPWNENWNKRIQVQTRIAGQLLEKEESAQKGELILTNPSASHKETVLVLGDSFFDAMRPYLVQDCAKVIYVHNVDIRNPKKEIDIHYLLNAYRPKRVIYEKMASFFFGHNYDSVFGTWRF